MRKRAILRIALGILILMPIVVFTLLEYRSQHIYDVISYPRSNKAGSIVIESHLGELNYYVMEHFHSKKFTRVIPGIPMNHPGIVKFRAATFPPQVTPKNSFEWSTFRNTTLVFAIVFYGICLILILRSYIVKPKTA